jgi:hypothetical protein
MIIAPAAMNALLHGVSLAAFMLLPGKEGFHEATMPMRLIGLCFVGLR